MRATGLGPSRVRCAHVVLHRAVAQTVRWGWLPRNPVSAATRPAVPRPMIVPPSVRTVRAALAAAETSDPSLWCYLLVALATVARRGEVCAPAAAPMLEVKRPRHFRLHFVYTGVMASGGTTTVRVRRPDSERLRTLAKTRKTTVIDVLHEAIDALERQEFLRGLNDDYRRLREDPAKWQAFIEERQEWDSIG